MIRARGPRALPAPTVARQTSASSGDHQSARGTRQTTRRGGRPCNGRDARASGGRDASRPSRATAVHPPARRLNTPIREMTMRHVARVLQHTGGDKVAAATIPRSTSTLYRCSIAGPKRPPLTPRASEEGEQPSCSRPWLPEPRVGENQANPCPCPCLGRRASPGSRDRSPHEQMRVGSRDVDDPEWKRSRRWRACSRGTPPEGRSHQQAAPTTRRHRKLGAECRTTNTAARKATVAARRVFRSRRTRPPTRPHVTRGAVRARPFDVPPIGDDYPRAPAPSTAGPSQEARSQIADSRRALMSPLTRRPLLSPSSIEYCRG